jgi:hypothetical protein
MFINVNNILDVCSALLLDYKLEIKKIVAKKGNLCHTGLVLAPIAKDNHKWRQSRKGELDDSINTIIRVKCADPLPEDVIKATQSFQGKKPTYNEAWRGLKYQKVNQKT